MNEFNRIKELNKFNFSKYLEKKGMLEDVKTLSVPIERVLDVCNDWCGQDLTRQELLEVLSLQNVKQTKEVRFVKKRTLSEERKEKLKNQMLEINKGKNGANLEDPQKLS